MHHPIFGGHENNPRKISNISMMLGSGKDLDEINKIIGVSEVPSTSSSRVNEEVDGASRVKIDFLHELKEHEEGIYNRLVLCAMFTNGLLVSEMEQISQQTNLNQNRLGWLAIITRLSRANSVNEIKTIKPCEEDVLKISEGVPLEEVLKANFMENKLCHKMWIDIKSENIEKKDQLRLLVDPSLRKIIIKQSQVDLNVFWTLLRVMVYLESFYSNMILKYKREKIYSENLVESS